MDRVNEEPCRSPLVVQRNHRGHSCYLIEQIEEGLHEVVWLHGASGDIHDWDAGLGFPVPAQIVGDTHSTGGITLHGMDTTIGSAGSCCYHCQGLWCQAINPIRHRNRLVRYRVCAEGCPVAFGLDLLVWDRSFKYENKRVKFTPLCFIPPLHKVFAPLVGDTLVMDVNPG